MIVALSIAPTAYAQQPQEPGTAQLLETEARAVFEAGTAAFQDSRYEDALQYFRRAYELSQRHELLYNIAIAADRLRRDEEALEAFEQFVERVPGHARRRDAETRIEVLRRTIAERGTQAANAEISTNAEPAAAPEGPDGLSIGFGGAIAAIGLAGVIAALVGVAGGGCIAMEGDVCVEERTTNWTAFGVYGGLGLAALAGGIVWLVISATASPAPRSVSFRADGVTWSF